MRLISNVLSKFVTSKIFFFILCSIVITLVMEKLPENLFDYKKLLFREQEWEKHGEIYNRIFKVKRWKGTLLELNDFIKSVFPKKYISTYSENYLKKYLHQSCKAEMTHYAIICSTLIFMITDELSGFFNMFLLANVLNMPYIIIQRFNRPRIIRYIEHLELTVQH